MTTNCSTIDLNNPDLIRVSESKRAIGFFCKHLPVRVDSTITEQLKHASRKHGNKNVRLCLHNAPEALFHTMIILEHKGKYYRPHKHLVKGECFHILEGSMAVFAFDDGGSITDCCSLTPNNCFLYRVQINQYHAVMPLSDIVLYHESKPGPFLDKNDSTFPAWAPEETDENAVESFNTMLTKTLSLTLTNE